MTTEVHEVRAPAFHVREARVEDAPSLAKIMAEAIDWGCFRDLGLGFSTVVHRHMILSQHTLCVVAERNGEILGYICGAYDNALFHQEFIDISYIREIRDE